MKPFRIILLALFTMLLTGALYTAGNADPVNGVYRITTRGQQKMCLDVEGWGNTPGTPVSLYWANHTSNQQWYIERQGDGTYKIYAYSGQNSLLMLDTAYGNYGNGNPVGTWDDNGNPAQLWYFRPVGGGYYRIIPKNAGYWSGQGLDIRGGNSAGIGSRTNIYTYYGGDNQVFRLDYPGPSQILTSWKKGLAGRPASTRNMHCHWVYTWGLDKPRDLPSNVEFVPMNWGYYGNYNNGLVNALNWAKGQAGVRTMLAFNEPDGQGQADLTVDRALEGYAFMSTLGIPIGSPACVHADDAWMQDFMRRANDRGYRVDYVTIHWYGGNDPQGFLNYVDYIHWLYNKPVWITEFCPADWGASRQPNSISKQDCWNFMRTVIPELNRRWYVDRYSWFSANTDDAPLGQGALVNYNGTLTDLGKLYARM